MKKKICILFCLIIIIVIFGFLKTEKINNFFTETTNKLGEYTSTQNQGLILYANNLIKSSKNESDMSKNTKYLQEIIDETSNAGGGIINIPAGTYYFAPAEEKNAFGDNRVIKCKNNVTIQGARK